jgi:hypothetical protein
MACLAYANGQILARKPTGLARMKTDKRPMPEPTAPRTRRFDPWLTSLLVIVGAIQFVTMPRFFYPGDNFAPRIEVAHWLETGKLGLPFTMKPRMAGFFEQRGQYFYENDKREVFFSKYGIGCTLAYLVPTLAERLYKGSANPLAQSESMMFFINLWQLVITLGIATYFYLTLGLYTSRRWLQVGLVLLAFYTTYVWNYLRAPTLEIYQMLPFLASFYHMASYLRSWEAPPPQTPRWGHLAAAVSFSCLLVWLKAFFVINCLVVAGASIMPGDRSNRLFRRMLGNLMRHPKQYIWALVVPGIFFASVVLVANAYRFGSPLTTGYEQWEYSTDGWLHGLHPKNIMTALHGFTVSRKHFNANIFIHYPLLLPALCGIPLFWTQRRRERWFLSALVIANLMALCTFKAWTGEWCYGPRYLIHLAILLTLPLVALAEWLLQLRSRWPKILFPAALLPVLAWSLTMQIYINSLHYFTWHYVHGAFGQFKQERVTASLSHYCHRGQLNADLIAHRRHKATFPALKVMGEMVAPQHRAVLQQVDAFVMNQAKPNYFFAK